MKVALISHEGGGISSVCFGLARHLARRGVEVTIFSSKAGFTTQVEQLNGSLKIVRSPMFDFPPNQISYQTFNLLSLSKMFRTYDVVHGVSPDASFIFALLKRKLELPFVGSIHSSPRASQRAFVNQPISTWTLSEIGFHIVEYPLHEFSVDRILRDSNHTTMCSFSLLEELKAYKKLNLNKVSVIHNGIDFDEIESTSDLPSGKSTQLSIIYAGRLFWFKGVMLLLEAFKRLRKNFPNANLRVFGKGPLEEKIKSFIAKSDLTESVDCFGYVSHKRLLVEIKKSDIAVFPSLSEAQPMFVLEAMACKKPVVLFDFPFAKEIVSDMNSGLLAKSGDVYDLCEKIQLLLSDADLRRRLGENAYLQVKKEHDWNVQCEKYLKVYQSIAN
jgi:glycosyltransferase involved in cell wall biosynthesis